MCQLLDAQCIKVTHTLVRVTNNIFTQLLITLNNTNYQCKGKPILHLYTIQWFLCKEQCVLSLKQIDKKKNDKHLFNVHISPCKELQQMFWTMVKVTSSVFHQLFLDRVIVTYNKYLNITAVSFSQGPHLTDNHLRNVLPTTPLIKKKNEWILKHTSNVI